MGKRGMPSYEKGKQAEQVAAKYIESIGYRQIQLTKSAGPDIIAWKDNAQFFFEVKPARKHSRTCWYANAVTPDRKKDHFVLIVLPNNQVFLETMSEYLGKCLRDGKRNLSNYIRTYCPDLFDFTVPARNYGCK